MKSTKEPLHSAMICMDGTMMQWIGSLGSIYHVKPAAFGSYHASSGFGGSGGLSISASFFMCIASKQWEPVRPIKGAQLQHFCPVTTTM